MFFFLGKSHSQQTVKLPCLLFEAGMFLELAQCCKHDRSMGLSGDAVHTRPHAFFPRIPEGFHDEPATAPGGGSELGLLRALVSLGKKLLRPSVPQTL